MLSIRMVGIQNQRHTAAMDREHTGSKSHFSKFGMHVELFPRYLLFSTQLYRKFLGIIHCLKSNYSPQKIPYSYSINTIIPNYIESLDKGVV